MVTLTFSLQTYTQDGQGQFQIGWRQRLTSNQNFRLNLQRGNLMKNQMRVHDDEGFDIEMMKKSFCKWIDQFEEEVLEKGSSEITQDGDKITFKFKTKWLVKVEKRVGDMK